MENMNITSAQYQMHEGKIVSIQAIIGGIVMAVPMDPSNRHYAEIMRQVEAGELTIEPADEVAPDAA